MPSARHTAAAARATRETSAQASGAHTSRLRPRQVTHRLPVSRIGWDRKFRLVMVVVLALVSWIGIRAAVALLSARAQAAQETSLVSSLEAQHRRLLAQERALHQTATIMRDARQLGMVRAGERSYVVVSPGN